jgi:hypothetical protein
MMNITEIIAEVCKETHVPMAKEAFGAPGLDAVFKVMETVQSLYRHVDPERISGEVIIYKVVRAAGTVATPATNSAAVDFASLANQTIENLWFEIEADGHPHARTPGVLTREALAETAVVYHYQAWREEFLAGTLRKSVLRLDPSARSQFSVPTFSNLREALQHFATESVRESTCYLFRKIWHDSNRLYLVAGPESIMRDSLTQYLRNRLGGDHDIFPEQNVNEKNPVDIRVQPRLRNNRLMIIEIKWIGNSVAADGHVTASHRDRRAQEGAVQLADYLDEQRQSAPSHVVQGFYVIIDARRRNLPSTATAGTAIARADGLHYESREIVFNPAPHTTRPDFDAPYRMFASPICTD